MKKHILLLHGALGSQENFDPLLPHLSPFMQVHRFNFYGHGGEKMPEDLTMPLFTEQIRGYIDSNIPADEQLSIFGYSMGGYAALLLAAKKIYIPARIITLGTKLAWDPAIAAKETTMLQPEVVEQKVPAFAEKLAGMHGQEGWKILMRQTAGLMQDLGQQTYLNTTAYQQITTPCKLMLGDSDKMVSLEETLAARKEIPGATFSVLPGTPHPIEKVNVERLVFELTHE